MMRWGTMAITKPRALPGDDASSLLRAAHFLLQCTLQLGASHSKALGFLPQVLRGIAFLTQPAITPPPFVAFAGGSPLLAPFLPPLTLSRSHSPAHAHFFSLALINATTFSSSVSFLGGTGRRWRCDGDVAGKKRAFRLFVLCLAVFRAV